MSPRPAGHRRNGTRLRIDNRRRRESVVLADAGVTDVAMLRREKPSAGFHSRGDGDQRQIALTDNFRIISPKVFQVVTGQPFGIAEMDRQHLAAHADLAKYEEATGGESKDRIDEEGK